jgi:hypothetical protein
LYQDVRKTLVTGGELKRIGIAKVLPTSFSGSSRHFSKLYQDAMAVVRKYGKPDLFITFTCNPKWPEIIENLLPGQQPSDRPDLCSTVFALKRAAIMKDIFQNGWFGEPVAYVYAIEFQKRGLPHCHLLIILKSESQDLHS